VDWLLRTSVALLSCQAALWVLVHARLGHATIPLWIFGPRILLVVAVAMSAVALILLLVGRNLWRSRLVALLCLVFTVILSWRGYEVYPPRTTTLPAA
jgi:hypothetical protein